MLNKILYCFLVEYSSKIQHNQLMEHAESTPFGFFFFPIYKIQRKNIHSLTSHQRKSQEIHFVPSVWWHTISLCWRLFIIMFQNISILFRFVSFHRIDPSIPLLANTENEMNEMRTINSFHFISTRKKVKCFIQFCIKFVSWLNTILFSYLYFFTFSYSSFLFSLVCSYLHIEVHVTYAFFYSSYMYEYYL